MIDIFDVPSAALDAIVATFDAERILTEHLETAFACVSAASDLQHTMLTPADACISLDAIRRPEHKFISKTEFLAFVFRTIDSIRYAWE